MAPDLTDLNWTQKSSAMFLPIKAKTGAGEKQAQISLSYLLNKDFIKVGPNENEAPPTFLWSVGKSDTRFPILICDLTTLSISGCSEQSD